MMKEGQERRRPEPSLSWAYVPKTTKYLVDQTGFTIVLPTLDTSLPENML